MIAMKAIRFGHMWDAHVSDGHVFGHGRNEEWQQALEQAVADYHARKDNLAPADVCNVH